MNTTKFKGQTVYLTDHLPEVGSQAFDFTFVDSKLNEKSLYDFEGKIKVIIALPSLDTGVCQAETRRFNKELEKIDAVVGIVISKDLPFAMHRFCETEGIANVIAGSDFRYNDFAKEYNVEMIDGVFKGLFARAVFVVDAKNTIRYVEVTNEIGDEPQYEKVMDAVKALL